jgi:hypothetical protein
MTANYSRGVKHSTESCIHGITRRKSRGYLRLKYNNVALLPKSLGVFAANSARHRSEVILGTHFIFMIVILFHKSVVPVVLLVGRL